MKALMLRLEAPLMAFGGSVVDANGIVRPFPAKSLVTGLLANALGYDQSESERHERLQQRLLIATRLDRPGETIVDFQTVDLGQAMFDQTGWTARGQREDRRGGPASSGTHIRYRHFRADGCATLALALDPANEDPTLDAVAAAVAEPARPLFIGRKSCIPSGPLLLGIVEAQTVLDALKRWPTLDRKAAELPAQWPIEVRESGERTLPLTDERDWRNQIHTGQRLVNEGTIEAAG
jgi:CRISPR system Cascade subunit CasD